MRRGVLGVRGLALAAGAVATVACGDEPTAGAQQGTPRLRVRLQAESETRPCEVGDRIDRLVVERFGARDDTWTFVTEVEGRACRDGGIPLNDLLPGAHRLRVQAWGVLTADRVLYSADVQVVVSEDAPVQPNPVILHPQIAFLRVGWLPPDGVTNVCGTEWSYAVRPGADFVNPGNPVSGRGDCADPTSPPPADRPLVLVPGKYDIDVRVEDEAGDVRYARSESRVLSPGSNVYRALLSPVGGRIWVDWAFQVGDELTRDCDTFGVEEVGVVLRVLGASGEVLASSRIPCSSRRPVPLGNDRDPVRVAAGRRLELRLFADADHVLRGRREFDMPAGDEELNIDLTPVGRGEVTWTIESETCTRPAPMGFDVRVEELATEEPVWSTSLPYAESATTTWFLPYGTYRVAIEAQPSNAPCGATAIRRIDAPENPWAPLGLAPLP